MSKMYRGKRIFKSLGTGRIDEHVACVREWVANIFFYRKSGKTIGIGAGGTYDCIALMAYYVVCRDVTSNDEIEQMEGNLFLPAFRRLKFVDVNRPIFKKLLHFAFVISAKKCAKWNDYRMTVAPYDNDKPIYYEFTACPTAEFAKQHDLLEVMPALCNPDYMGMEFLHARLVRKTTCANGCKCDYTLCGDRDPYCAAHPEYRDAEGYRRND